MKRMIPSPIELLAPAKDGDTAIAAVRCGADAVYIGPESFGARSEASNSLGEIERVVSFAHRFRVKVYVTVNTVIYEHELARVEKLIGNLYDIGVDALIVQDMGLLRLDIPPIALHASTQCDIRTPERAKFLEDVGFSQLVLPREMSLDEIRRVRDAVTVPLEAFVHGALCVSYSGDCFASQILKGRSANRGECAQICRLPYDLYDGKGRIISKGKHLLSLKDLNRSASLGAMLDAGVTSFKIEGRLKDIAYVKNVVSYYSDRLDKLVELNPEKYRRASCGIVERSFEPAVEKSFNRGFTTYFLDGPQKSIASVDTPKSKGVSVGKVKAVKNGVIEASLVAPLSNGDGIGYIDKDGIFSGFRLNRVEGNRLYPASPVHILPGTELFRNYDKKFDDQLKKDVAERRIPLKATLRYGYPGSIALDVSDDRGNDVSVTYEIGSIEQARSNQFKTQSDNIGKLGGTIYIMKEFGTELDDAFIPASALSALKRKAIEMLDRANNITYPIDLRRQEQNNAVFPDGKSLTYHENVSNSKAHGFYCSHGVECIQKAVEVELPDDAHIVVMNTRYCVRKELGICLKEDFGRKVPGPLTLKNGDIVLGLEFDCEKCGMKVKNYYWCDKNRVSLKIFK